jgi:hypothetical protein
MLTTARALTAAGAGLIVLALSVPIANAQVYPVTVTGQETCDLTTGPVGRASMSWTVTNGDGLELTITSAVESGALNVPVSINPNPIPPNSAGTGVDAPAGNPNGVVTLTVMWSASAGGTSVPTTGTSTGSVTTTGNCIIPTTTTVVSPATVAAVTATPAFTG